MHTQEQTAPGAAEDGETQVTQPGSPRGSIRGWGEDWEIFRLCMGGGKCQVPETLPGAAV